MSFYVPSYEITSPVLEVCGECPQLHPQYDMSSDVGHLSFKKPRMSEIVPSSRLPMINKAMFSNFEVPPLKNFNVGLRDYEGRCAYRPAFNNTCKPLPYRRGIEVQKGQLAGSSSVGCGISNELKVCRMFHNGKKCTYGDQCRFLHEIPERISSQKQNPERIKKGFGLSNKSCEVGISATGHIVDQRSGFDQLEEMKSGPMRIGSRNEMPKPVHFKTRLCYNWQITGQCSFENVCRFAHGEAELLQLGCSVLECRSLDNTSTTTITAAEAGLRSSRGTGTDHKNQVSKMKQLFKSNKLVKLIGIYADWLED